MTKTEMEVKKKQQTDHKLSSDSGVHCWWHHEGKNNHNHEFVGPPKLFNKIGHHIQTKLSSGCYNIVFFTDIFQLLAKGNVPGLLVILLHHW
jgi:hypothetical protein